MSDRTFRAVPTGYPSLAALTGRDKAFSIFRRFRTLSARSLLYLQSELMELESQLRTIDTQLANVKPEALSSWAIFAEDHNRRTLIDKIREKLDLYSKVTTVMSSAVRS